MSETVDHLVAWMRQRVLTAGANGLVVGLSGGVDSAVVARLAQLATPGDAVAVVLPCHSDPQDEHDARLIAKHFELPTAQVDLDRAYEVMVEALKTGAHGLGTPAGTPPPDAGRVPLANLKPRLRMTALYFLANARQCLVAGTGNRCEIEVGYYTKHGDGAADMLPLGGLVKSEVYALARELEVPDAILDRRPSAGLWIGQSDEDELGFSYRHLESYLADGPQAVPPALALRIERLIRGSDHKRSLPPTPSVNRPLAD